jgi:hypothetical protein
LRVVRALRRRARVLFYSIFSSSPYLVVYRLDSPAETPVIAAAGANYYQPLLALLTHESVSIKVLSMRTSTTKSVCSCVRSSG